MSRETEQYDKDKVNKAKIEKAPQPYIAKHITKKTAASPEASKNRCSCPAKASTWYGHQEETITANIENETAEVESISSDMAPQRRQPVQMAQFSQKETDTQYMNIVVAALTTGIDAAVSQAQPTAQQQFQTTFDDEQSLESETDQHRGEQDRQRHCRQQAGKVR